MLPANTITNTITSRNMAANKITSINVIRENNYVPECNTPTHLQLHMWPAKTFTSTNVARKTLTSTKWPKKTFTSPNVSCENM